MFSPRTPLRPVFALAKAGPVLALASAQVLFAGHSLPMPESGVYEARFNERVASAVPANLDGDSLTDWVGELSFKGKETYAIEARSFDGELLWEFDSGLIDKRMVHYKHVPLTVWDFDGDGIDEVITLKFGRTDNPPIRASIVVLDGATGELEASTPVPWSGGAGNSRFNHGTLRSYGTVAYLDGPDRAPSYVLQSGTYVDGVCWAFDFIEGQLVQRWSYQHAFHIGTGQHGLTAFDVDEDGREDILMGGTVLDADGCKIFSWSDMAGYGHCDGAIPGDLDPSRPGVEILFHHEFGFGAALTSGSGEVYWHDDEVYHLHSAWVADVREKPLGDEVRGRAVNGERWTWVLGNPDYLKEKMSHGAKYDKLVDIDGNEISKEGFERTIRPPEWTGDSLHDSWDDVLAYGEIAARNMKHDFDTNEARPHGVDLGGGHQHGAEEILFVKGGLLQVFFNREAKPYPSRWENRNYRRMAVSALGSGYAQWETFRVWDLPVKASLPTAYLAVEGARNIGTRSQEVKDGERILAGKRFVLFKGANIQFLGTGSWDSDGDEIVSYDWDFGDGTGSRKADPVKRFDENGVYDISLTIEAGGDVSRESATVIVQDHVLNYVSHIEHEFDLEGFGEGSKLYTDTDYVAESVPEQLRGSTLIRTHYEIEGMRAGLLDSWNVTAIPMESITFDAGDDMVVYLAMDEFRMEENAPLLAWEDPSIERPFFPEWVLGDGWERTEMEVVNSRNGRPHRVYRKSVMAGDTVRLGPNRYKKPAVGDMDRNMYFVLLSIDPSAADGE